MRFAASYSTSPALLLSMIAARAILSCLLQRGLDITLFHVPLAPGGSRPCFRKVLATLAVRNEQFHCRSGCILHRIWATWRRTDLLVDTTLAIRNHPRHHTTRLAAISAFLLRYESNPSGLNHFWGATSIQCECFLRFAEAGGSSTHEAMDSPSFCSKMPLGFVALRPLPLKNGTKVDQHTNRGR